MFRRLPSLKRSAVLIVSITALSCAAPAPSLAPAEGSGSPPYTDFNLQRAVRDAQAQIDRLDIKGNGMPSYQRLVERGREMLDAESAGAEEISQAVIDLMAWQYFFTSSDQHIPPIPLIETNHELVTPPPGVHPFYTKYLNAYEDDHTQGIVIVTSDAVHQSVERLRDYSKKLDS